MPTLTGRVGRECLGPCAGCPASFPKSSFFRFHFFSHLHFFFHFYNFPSDIGSNIGSFSVAVAGMRDPTRQVGHMQFTSCWTFLSNLLPQLTSLLPPRWLPLMQTQWILPTSGKALKKTFCGKLEAWGWSTMLSGRFSSETKEFQQFWMRSDTRGILYPFNEYPDNPGRTRMVHKDELMKMTEGLKGKKIVKLEAVNAVLLQDILSSITPTTIILKIDIEGYECKVST